MGRKPAQTICYACLIIVPSFYKLSKKDENNVTLLTKLQSCIREVEWTSADYICLNCTELLNAAYEFRETCLNSDIIRKKDQRPSKTEDNGFKELPHVGNDCNDLEKQGKKYQAVNEGVISIAEKGNEELQNGEVDDNDHDDDILDPTYCSEDEDDEKTDNEVERNDNGYQTCKRKRKENNHKKKEDQPKKKRKKIKFVCEKCETNFSTSTKLVDHCIKEHEMDLKDVKPFVCDRCPQRFSSSSNLWQHIKYHDGIKSNMCSYCGNGFITKTDLINHEKKHLNMREYECEACGKSFNTHKDIRSHKLIVHTDSSKWKYVCEICNKPFPIKSNYDSHMRRHTGDKKFACHLCDKKFTTKCDMQRHTRSHSHVREHRCQHCEKEYKDERVLKVHMAKIHGIGLGKVKIPVRERKYACHFCPKTYYAKNKLTRHIYTHSGEKPFNCPICEKKFNDKSYVKQHLKNTHNVEQQDTLENELKINYMNFSEPKVVKMN